jgi:DNA-binding Lrp family transcriptional regulator
VDKMYLDSLDRKLLNLVQAEFPLTTEPYTDLGLRLGIDGDEVLHRIKQLKAKGIIRQISPVLDARSLGYQTTLVAMRVAESQLDTAARLIVEHPGISHGYERDHHFNLWFTLALPPEAGMEAELQKLSTLIGAEAMLELPVLKIFKIGAYFDLAGDGQPMPGASIAPSSTPSPKADLSPTDRAVINELQQELPLVQRPFDMMAARLTMDAGEFLAHLHSLQQGGIMRRFGASIRHNNVGFKANAMTCWVAPPEVVEIAGRKIATFPEVSHYSGPIIYSP